eukprot:GHRQ01014291.1.p1 GENE.GHRQ01014291.1~~GHRQ01014291.1.p1  ORF type:complete len:172 (-),score=20.74 GHRQ01014291.1:253-768(-)
MAVGCMVTDVGFCCGSVNHMHGVYSILVHTPEQVPTGCRHTVLLCPWCSCLCTTRVRAFLARCNPLGHGNNQGHVVYVQGMTCAQFQALPPELRSIEDAAMLRMAQQQAWKRCPAAGCGHVVERTEGCNHMRCRCGVDFCYACGSAYSSSQPSADNVHGIPGCSCPLFPHM